ncbi:MAG: helix-turn-helix domain-containing protein [Actinobacteria bacterium]|nr:helix-turn-helix domain-containing protein [Actinomycetota bacterium]MBI3686667.1 helix-turn-helix domain-containing protein [Actinomycetota bacterium]
MRPGSSDAVRQVFGLALRQLRTRAGLSLRGLGQAVHYDYSRLSRVENGDHLIGSSLVPVLDDAVGAGGLLIMLRSLAGDDTPVPGPTALPHASFHVDDGVGVMLELRTLDGRTVRVSLPRREFAQLLATGALWAVLPAGVADLDQVDRVSKVLDDPRRIDPPVLDYFRTLLVEHFTADKMCGPRQLLGPVLAQIDVLDGLRRHTRPGTAEPTLRLLAQYAEFAGWLHQDAGDTHAAMYWSDRATQWAQATGDYQMVSYLLVRKSNIALLDDDAVNVVELAAAARKVPGPLNPKLAALASQQEARGWALHGDTSHFQADLDTAANLLREHHDDVDDTAPIYLRHYDLDTLEEQSASCYRASGHAEAAIVILERKIAATPQHMHRDQGHQLAKLANIVVATTQPDPERAATLGLRCVTTAGHTGSARISKELYTLDRTLTSRWPDLPGTVELHEALAI